MLNDNLTSLRAYYFGCANNEKGHYLWKPNGGRTVTVYASGAEGIPEFFIGRIDGSLAPPGPEVQSAARRHLVHGFTVLAMWDRTVDTRGKSNAAFIIEGEHTFDEARHIARDKFPSITARIEAAAPIHEWSPK